MEWTLASCALHVVDNFFGSFPGPPATCLTTSQQVDTSRPELLSQEPLQFRLSPTKESINKIDRK